MSQATVAELQRAWRAVQAGQFADQHAPRSGSVGPGWSCPAGERLLPVVGAQGRSGASTLALALATRMAPARVVECVAGPASGLVSASTAELGDWHGLWVRGRRGEVMVERPVNPVRDCGDVPVPSVLDRISQVTVVDVGWDLTWVLGSGSWLAAVLGEACAVVVTAEATVPGLRRLDAALGLLPGRDCALAILGPPRRRWPRALSAALGPLARQAERDGLLVTVPVVASVRLTGVDSHPLPAAVLRAAASVLRVTGEFVNGKDQ